jgi:hypothetical protein
MTLQEFKKEVEEFCSLVDRDYRFDITAEYFQDEEDEQPYAQLKVIEPHSGFEIFMFLHIRDDDEIVISEEPDMYALKFNLQGFYCYLFFEAARRLTN